MKGLFQSILFIILINLLSGCSGQTEKVEKLQQTSSNKKENIVGGGCDGCEIMFVGMPMEINSVDTSMAWKGNGQKLLVTGTVFKINGRTPAPDVIVYYWQTDNNGYYSPIEGIDEKVKRHGHVRGWVKSNKDGKYSIYTIRPAPYPNEEIPAHMHISIKEPTIENEYYIDDLCFDDDNFLIQSQKRKPPENRGGSGVLRVLISNDLQIAEHNIILGLNIPDYTDSNKVEKQSGLEIGVDNPSFIPIHAFGPDKGTRTCPVCKYGRFHGILYFVGANSNWDDIKKWLLFLEEQSLARGKYLKAYFIYGNETNFDKDGRQREIERIGNELNLKNVALTFVPSLTDTKSEVHLNKINPKVENTFIIYRHIAIIDKFIDLKPTSDNFKLLSIALDNTKNEYFNLEEPK